MCPQVAASCPSEYVPSCAHVCGGGTLRDLHVPVGTCRVTLQLLLLSWQWRPSRQGPRPKSVIMQCEETESSPGREALSSKFLCKGEKGVLPRAQLPSVAPRTDLLARWGLPYTLLVLYLPHTLPGSPPAGGHNPVCRVPSLEGVAHPGQDLPFPGKGVPGGRGSLPGLHHAGGEAGQRAASWEAQPPSQPPAPHQPCPPPWSAAALCTGPGCCGGQHTHHRASGFTGTAHSERGCSQVWEHQVSSEPFTLLPPEKVPYRLGSARAA